MGGPSPWRCSHKQEGSLRKGYHRNRGYHKHVLHNNYSVLNKPTSSHLVTELTRLEERVKRIQKELANEQEAYDDVSWKKC